jgi:hypothetical protein
MRKSIDVSDVIDMVNRRLKCSVYSPAERYAMIFVLEDILHQTCSYKGYLYLQEYPSEYATKEQWAAFDDSRRQYLK